MLKSFLILISIFFSIICNAQQCDENIKKHVYNPQRLVEQSPSCISVTGYVFKIKKEVYDGDYHINIIVDSQYVGLLNKGNLNSQDGCLVVEIICAIKFGAKHSSKAVLTCKDYTNGINIPKKGDYVNVTGFYVFDKSGTHGWNELHPVTKLEILKRE